MAFSAGAADVELPDLSGSYTADLSKSWRQENPFRSRICLDGAWRLALSETIAKDAPAEDSEYGFVTVPSSWMHPLDFPISGTGNYAAGKYNGACKWKGKPFKSYICGWYRREFITPSGLDGRKVFLRLDRVTLSASVRLNGTEIGSLDEREQGRWDVTALLKKDGSPNQLQVRVSACLNEEITFYLAGDSTSTKKQEASLRGITGDVWLESEPDGPVVTDVFAIPSFRKKEICFETELKPASGSLTALAEVYEKGGSAPLLEFRSPPISVGTQRISLGGAWKDPVLWELDNPHLYEVRVSLLDNGRKIDETLPVQFGFREAWIDGRNVMLNGKPLHLYSLCIGGYESIVAPAFKNARKEIDLYRELGFNSIQLRSEGIYEKGTAAECYGDVFNICDAEGIPVIMPIIPVYALKWDSAKERAKWERDVSTLVRKYRNHPSLLFYSMNFNYVGYPWDLNPHKWATDYAAPDSIQNLRKRRKDSAESEEFLRGLDGSRVIYHHQSGNFRSMITSNFYINWPPLQEYEEYPSLWAEKGRKPLLFVELGIAHVFDFYRGREGYYEKSIGSEMLEAEYASEFLGPDAFRMQDDAYLDIIVKNATSEKAGGHDKYNVQGPYTWNYALNNHEPLNSYAKLSTLLVMRGWRTYGFTGFAPNGMTQFGRGRRFEAWRTGVAGVYSYDDLTRPGAKPACYYTPEDAERPSESSIEASSVLKPVLLYVGGGEREGFAAKDHSYFSGDAISKQAVLVNDLRHDLPLDVKWSLVQDSTGKPVAEGALSLEAKAGFSTMKAFSTAAPDVKAKEGFTLKLEAQGLPPAQSRVWDFKLQVFPRNAAKFERMRIALYDPIGETEKVLKSLGATVVQIKEGSGWRDCDFAVLGRGSFTAAPPPPQELFAAVKDGMTLLSFEQKDLSLLGLRVHPRGVRNVFPLMKGHPVLAGLSLEDLSDWRGAFTSIDPYEQPSLSDDRYPEETWRWGANGTVCSNMIEKPHVGASRSVLECGFDLNYTPLLEAREGKGRLLLCQLELSNRYGIDPAASLVLENLVKYAASSRKLPSLRSVVSTGGKAEDSLVSTIGGRNTKADIIVCGDVSGMDRMGWPDFVKEGGTVIMVGQDFLKDLSWLPVPVKTQQAVYYRATPNGSAPLMRGVSDSDLFLKDRRQDLAVLPSEGVTPLAEPGMIAEVAWGKGRFILFGIDPLSYKDSKVSPERMTRIYCKLSRVLSCLVANLDGDFRGLSDKHYNGGFTPDIPLPNVWKFMLDPQNSGRKSGWTDPAFDDSAWKSLKVPGIWEAQGVTEANPNLPKAERPYDGYAWYRCKVKIPKEYQGKSPCLLLGKVDDMDSTYFNGVKIGQVDSDFKNYYSVVRDYAIPESAIKFGGENAIAVKVYDNFWDGGILGPQVYIHVKTSDDYPYLNQRPAFNPYHLTRW